MSVTAENGLRTKSESYIISKSSPMISCEAPLPFPFNSLTAKEQELMSQLKNIQRSAGV